MSVESDSASVSGVTDGLPYTIATACRILAHRGMVDGVLGHVSARLDDGTYLIRCRGPRESGVGLTQVEDIRRITADGNLVETESEWSPPKETPIHTGLLARRLEVGAVVHAHPPAALLSGLANLTPRPVFGAFNIPAMRMALGGIPVYPRGVLISRPELANEMMDVMGDRPICLLRGHGITVVGPSVESATVAAINFNELLVITVELARLGANPPGLGPEDLAELPDLGQAFNDGLAWRALVAELEFAGRGLPRPEDG
ncbi:MAG TPA: class II aldolase/adducin family protein [Acidimicrobiales bacterium]